MSYRFALVLIGMICVLSGCSLENDAWKSKKSFELFPQDRNAKLIRDSLDFFHAMSANDEERGRIHQAIMADIESHSSFDRPLEYGELYSLILQSGRKNLSQIALQPAQRSIIVEHFRNDMMRIHQDTMTAGVNR